MNYMQYLTFDDTNGEGARCTLFVSGCELGCKGCHNEESWNPCNGIPYTKAFEDQLIRDLHEPFIQGLSLSGGHPLHHRNYTTCLELCKRVYTIPDKDIWLWSGLVYEDILAGPYFDILNYVDILVDGPFIEELYSSALKHRGSSNQRVIDVTKSLSDSEIVLYLED